MKKLPDLVTLHTMAWLALVGLAVYLLLAPFVSGEHLQEMSASLNLGVSVAVVFSWAPAAFYAIRRRAFGKNQLIIAVFTMFSVFVVVRAYGVAYAAAGGTLQLAERNDNRSFRLHCFPVGGLVFSCTS